MSAKTLLAAAIVSLLWAGAAGAQPAVELKSADGAETLTLGLLAQASASIDTADGQQAAKDFCFRRLRLIAGGKIARKIKFFIDSDTPYLGHHGALSWGVPATFVQDLIVTAELRETFQIDAGWLLVPVSYNSTQSAASLLAVGYGPYSFLASAPTKSRVGRDEGVQARGYLFHKRLEYRAGTFLGARKQDDVPMRYAARVVWYPFGAQTGFFYAGTLHAARKLVSVGASIDAQGTYRSHSVDAFAELPLPNRDAVTLQADYIHYDGASTFTSLPRQDTWMMEGGYRFGGTPFGAYAQIARQDLAAVGAADAASLQAGVAYWARGHRLNVKGGLGRTTKDRTAPHTQVTGQLQVFIF